MSRVAALLLAVAMVFAVGVAGAWGQDDRLTGSYEFTTKRTCTVAGLPFEPPVFAIPAGTPFLFRQANVDSGVFTFNGDGTGSIHGRSKVMNLTATGGGVLSISEFTAPLAYTVNLDGSVDLVLGPSSFEVLEGAGVGNTGSTTGIGGRLLILPGNMLMTAPAEGIRNETVVLSFAGGGGVTQHRICVRSTVARKLQ